MTFTTALHLCQKINTMPRSSKVHTAEIRQIALHKQRKIVAKLLFDLVSIFSEKLKPRTASHLDTYFVGLAVYVGFLHDQPMTSRRLRVLLKMKKSTVDDRLRFLQRHNYICREGHTWSVPPAIQRKPLADILRGVELVIIAARQLQAPER